MLQCYELNHSDPYTQNQLDLHTLSPTTQRREDDGYTHIHFSPNGGILTNLQKPAKPHDLFAEARDFYA